MKKAKKALHLQTLAWLMTACLIMTAVTPSFTSFAASQKENVSSSAQEDTSLKDTEDPEAAHAGEDPFENKNTTDEAGNPEEESKEDPSAGSQEDLPEGSTGSAGEGSEDDPKNDSGEDTGENPAVDPAEDSADDLGNPVGADDQDPSEDPAVDDPEAGESAGDAAVVPEDTSADAVEDADDAQYDEAGKDDINEDPEEDEEEELDGLDGELDSFLSVLSVSSPSDAEKAVCMYNGNYYETVEEVIELIGNGSGTISLTRDAELQKSVEIKGSEIVFDLQGHTLTGGVYVSNKANVTVQNGTVEAGSTYWRVYASGTDDDPTQFTLGKDAEMRADIYGLVIGGEGGLSGRNGAGFKVTIDGVIDTGKDDPATDSAGIWLMGNMKTTSAKVCDLTVNGTLYAEGPAIAENGWGNVTVGKDAVLSGGTGIEIRAGSLNVMGGSVTGFTEEFKSWPNSNGNTTNGAGIAISEYSTDIGITVNISGGDISGYYALAQVNNQNQNQNKNRNKNKNKNNIDLTITGGSFTGYDDECAIFLNDYGTEGTYSITGGTFVNGNDGGISDISKYLPSDYEQNDEGGITPSDPVSRDDDNTGSDNDDNTGSDNDDNTGSDNNGNTGSNTGSSGGHHSSGGHSGGSGSGARPAGVSSSYTDANGMKADWHLTGNRFTMADGTHPSYEYLKINGIVYAFYAGGYAIPSDDKTYYSEDAITSAGYIPEVTGTWDLSGWCLQYSDGSYPRNEWAQLTHNGRKDWYHFDQDGWMQTGWEQIDGYWYFFGDDGAMLSSTQTPDGHTVDASGRLVR